MCALTGEQGVRDLGWVDLMHSKCVIGVDGLVRGVVCSDSSDLSER